MILPWNKEKKKELGTASFIYYQITRNINIENLLKKKEVTRIELQWYRQ